jgi:hypothetical protein
MAIYIITGATGSGKSLKQIEYGLKQANTKRKAIVTNFEINRAALIRYAAHTKQYWLAHIADRHMIANIDANTSLAELLTFPNSVVLLDEAGIFLSVMEYQKAPKKLLYDACQSRKDGIDIVAAAQFDEQIHKQFRMLAHYIIHADGVSQFDKKTKRPKLVWKTYFHFTAKAYAHWQGSRDETSYLKTRLKHSIFTEHGFLTKADRMLFEIFNSFSRLDVPNRQLPLGYNYCILPEDYYTARTALIYSGHHSRWHDHDWQWHNNQLKDDFFFRPQVSQPFVIPSLNGHKINA